MSRSIRSQCSFLSWTPLLFRKLSGLLWTPIHHLLMPHVILSTHRTFLLFPLSFQLQGTLLFHRWGTMLGVQRRGRQVCLWRCIITNFSISRHLVKCSSLTHVFCVFLQPLQVSWVTSLHQCWGWITQPYPSLKRTRTPYFTQNVQRIKINCIIMINYVHIYFRWMHCPSKWMFFFFYRTDDVVKRLLSLELASHVSSRIITDCFAIFINWLS